MEKTFGQTEETNNEQVPQTHDETSVAVANLTTILEEPTTPATVVNK